MLFNLDMDKRLADLYAAIVCGAEITTERLPAFTHDKHTLPERVAYSFGEGRRFVLDLPTTQQMADYLSANGYPDTAEQLRTVAA